MGDAPCLVSRSGFMVHRRAASLGWGRQARETGRPDRYEQRIGHSRPLRQVEYQRIIVGELLKHGKQITINGKDYEQIPENKLTLTMLGAFAEFGRAKIIERTSRGRLHRLRMREMSSNGHRIYGYHYVKKTSTAPATLVINEAQAAVLRSIFEMFASGNYGLVTSHPEERRILTSVGRQRWDNDRIKSILKTLPLDRRSGCPRCG
jgi:site-specific DNA recombinase